MCIESNWMAAVLQRLTEDAGSHSANFDPSFSQFLDTWSDAQTPPQVRLHSADGKVVRVIDENRGDLLDNLSWASQSFLQVKTATASSWKR